MVFTRKVVVCANKNHQTNTGMKSNVATFEDWEYESCFSFNLSYFPGL